MSIENFLNRVRKKIAERNTQKPCPTPVLLYIAAKWNYHSEVEPWYGYIKKLTGGVDKNSLEFHSAVIYGMYPQLKQASLYFVEKAGKYLQENRPNDEEWRKKSVKRKVIDELKKIEQETLLKFGLSQTYDIYNLSEEQKDNIKHNLIQTENHLINKTLSNCSPVIQILASAVRNNAVAIGGHHPLAFATSMEWMQNTLDRGKEKNQKPNYSNYTFPQERYEITKQIFEMQDDGILDEKFNIKDYTAFCKSRLVREFPYRGKIYDLSDQVKLPNQNSKVDLLTH